MMIRPAKRFYYNAFIPKGFKKIKPMRKVIYPKIQKTNSFTYSFQNKQIQSLKSSKSFKSYNIPMVYGKSSKYFTLENMNNYSFKGFSRGAIRKNIFIYKVKKKHVKLSKNETCVICLSSLDKINKIRRTPCGHMFHTKCISTWLKKKSSCPYCRLNLLKKKEVDLNIF